MAAAVAARKERRLILLACFFVYYSLLDEWTYWDKVAGAVIKPTDFASEFFKLYKRYCVLIESLYKILW